MPSILWPKLSEILKPCKGERMAVVYDTVTTNMLLIDLAPDRMFVVMSDSVAEKEMCEEAVKQARGDVLLFGFGLGLILIPIMNKPEVTSVTVVEINPEVLSLVASQLDLNDKVKIVQMDAHYYEPSQKFDFIWWDIDVSGEQVTAYEESGISTNFEARTRSWLKPDGVYLEWCDDGRYRS